MYMHYQQHNLAFPLAVLDHVGINSNKKKDAENQRDFVIIVVVSTVNSIRRDTIKKKTH